MTAAPVERKATPGATSAAEEEVVATAGSADKLSGCTENIAGGSISADVGAVTNPSGETASCGAVSGMAPAGGLHGSAACATGTSPPSALRRHVIEPSRSSPDIEDPLA
jgi:hypothetical protein